MADKYYGWQQVTGYPGASDSYVPPDYSGAKDYTPTTWDSVKIEDMWSMVQKESDERAFALAEMWKRTSSLLQATRDNLQQHADALAAKWRSSAGEIFLRNVGATLYSLDEWKKIADDNATGLEQLGKKIQEVQREFKPIWEDYKAEAQVSKNDAEDDTFSDIWNEWTGPGSDLDEVRDRYHGRALGVVKPLADLFIDVYIHNVSSGTTFKGPTNAVVTNPSDVPRPSRPAAPGSPPPGLSGDTLGRASARPNAPVAPDGPPKPNAPDTPPPPPPPPGVGTPPPGLPDGVSLAGGTVAPPAPTGPAPTPPPVTTAPGPAPAPPPVAPTGLTGRPGVPPTGPPPAKPNLPGAGNGNRPNAPGSTGPRGPAPSQPTLPGRGAPAGTRPGAPGGPGASGSPGAGRRGAAPGAPRLSGSTGTPAPPGAPRTGGPGSGRPASPPPSLGGKRGAAPGEPGAPRSGSGRPGTPQGTPPPGSGRPGSPLSGRGSRPGAPGMPEAEATRSARPGAGPGTPPNAPKADLTGRAGAGPKAPTAGPQPALGGRRGGTAGQGQPAVGHRAPGDEHEAGAWESDELWWVDESDAVGTIEAPAEHRPQEQGKALGQG
jgi:hypothetical protein